MLNENSITIHDSHGAKYFWDKLDIFYEVMNQNQILHIQSQSDSLSLNIGEKIEIIQCVLEMRASLQALHETMEDT